MFSRMLQWSSALVVGVMVAAGPARSIPLPTPIVPGGLYNLQISGNPYQAKAEPTVSGAFVDQYFFKVFPNTTADIFASVQYPAPSPPNTPVTGYIKDLVIKWVGGSS